jgi:ABC-type branched-subunit amino acid transport system permease subunit
VSEAARDLYLLVAVFGLVPAVRLAGLPVLAASAFAAIGGVGALQLERAGLAAIAMGAVAGALTGALVARATPPFVALTTWALAWLAYTVLLGFPSLSGGGQGLTRPALDRVETPIGVTVTLTPRLHVVAAAVLCVLVYAFSLWVTRSPAGREATAARDDRELAASLRIPSRRVELLALAGGAAAAAGAGLVVWRRLRPRHFLVLDVGDRRLVMQVTGVSAGPARELANRIRRALTSGELPTATPTLP